MSTKKMIWYGVLLVVVLSIVGIVCRVINTGSKMAEKTILNADKNVWSYENFHAQYNQYQQYKKQLKDAETRLDTLEARGVTSGQRYDNLATEVDGIRNMLNRIAADYNKASGIWYQDIWKSKGLPKHLE
jgi:hypothetical protein